MEERCIDVVGLSHGTLEVCSLHRKEPVYSRYRSQISLLERFEADYDTVALGWLDVKQGPSILCS